MIVEDGTGLVDANSYASVAEADAYFSARGVTDWKNSDTAKEIRTLTLSSGASGDGNILITLNGVAFTVPITTGSATHVCAEIRAFAFQGWTAGGSDGFVTFTASKAELRAGAYSLAPGGTGVAGAFTQDQAGSDAAKEAALVRGTSALDGMYASAWPGRKVRGDQALEWPRVDAVDFSGYGLDGVPRAVKVATCEAALIELLTPGALSPSLDRGGAIIREKVGPIETEYASNAPAATVYATIRQALASIVPAGGGPVRLARG